MTYNVFFSQRAEKQLGKLARQKASRVVQKAEKLSNNPYPSGCTTVKGADERTYRIRVGNLRVLYTVDEKQRRVLIAKIDKRDRVYNR